MPTPPPTGRPPFRRVLGVALSAVGVVLTVVLVLCGLAAVAGFVLYAVAMNSYASNK